MPSHSRPLVSCLGFALLMGGGAAGLRAQSVASVAIPQAGIAPPWFSQASPSLSESPMAAMAAGAVHPLRAVHLPESVDPVGSVHPVAGLGVAAAAGLAPSAALGGAAPVAVPSASASQGVAGALPAPAVAPGPKAPAPPVSLPLAPAPMAAVPVSPVPALGGSAQAPFTTAPLAPLPLPADLRWREEPRLGELFRQAGRSGTFVVLDVRRGELVGTNRARALSRYTPASTFKIPNSLIGLSVGAVASVDTVLPYRSDAPPFSPAWEKDMGLRQAIVVSNVPIYQELARRIGLERMREAVNRLDYGNRQIGSVVDTFWLRGPLAISAVEQTRFLDRLARGELPFPAEAQRAVREITLVERGPGWELHAKTGWQNGPNPGVGWWVGWVETGGRTVPFALNLDIHQRADGELRQRLGRAALELLGVLPPSPPASAPSGSAR